MTQFVIIFSTKKTKWNSKQSCSNNATKHLFINAEPDNHRYTRILCFGSLHLDHLLEYKCSPT